MVMIEIPKEKMYNSPKNSKKIQSVEEKNEATQDLTLKISSIIYIN